jgi:hypothetical protein
VNIQLLLQAIGQETDYQISFVSDQEFYLNHEKMEFESGLFFVHGTRMRMPDPRDLLFELKSERVLQLDAVTIKNILRFYHKLERDAKKNKTIQTFCG